MFKKQKEVNKHRKNKQINKNNRNKKNKKGFWSTLKSALTNKDLMKKIGITIFFLFIYRLGNNILVSGVDTKAIGGTTGLEILNLLTGADMGTFSLFSLGLTSFITGSIIIELLSNDVIPVLTRIRKDNDNKKKTKIANGVGLAIAIFQAFSITLAMDRTYGVLKYPDVYSYIYTTAVMVAGGCILLWIAKQIDTYGVGNGSSVIIAAGILYKFPKIIAQSFDTIVSYKKWQTFISFGALMLVFVLMIMFVVYIERSERRIKTGNSIIPSTKEGANKNYMPIKVNASGVVPVIFASSVIQMPTVICTLIGNSPDWLKYFSLSNPVGIALYGVLIVFFVFYYSDTIINAEKINDDFKKNGGNIIGIRLGQDTIHYIRKTLFRVCTFGSIALLLIALIPIVLPLIWKTAASTQLTIGGTSLIIVTGVAYEIYSKIKAEMNRNSYAKQNKSNSSFY